MKNLIKLSLVLLPLFANATSIEYKGNDTIKSTVIQSDDISLIKESVGKALKEKFGYELNIDPSMDNGCYNYLDYYITKNEKSPVKDQGYLHDLYSMDSSPLQFSPQYFANGIIETVDEPAFSRHFELFHPTNFWVTSKKIGDRYYLIISLK